MSDQLDTAAIRETQPSPEPVAWQYRYADPLTGKPIWRMRSDTWNGQRAKEGRPLYTTPQPDELARLVGQIKAIVAAYDRDVPIRSADWHVTDCDCLRCNIDNARAALAQKGDEA